MDRLFYCLARVAVAVLQSLPLLWVAQLGRWGGEVFFWVDARHRRVALRNLTLSFGTIKSSGEIRSLAHENFRRIGENYCCAVKSASMSEPELKKVLEVQGLEPSVGRVSSGPAESRVFATGHFGNFELFTRLSSFLPGYRCAATYRGLHHEHLGKLLHSMRTLSGNLLFERRTGADDLKKAMSRGGLLLVLVSDQSAGEKGLELPFLGRPCLTTRAPAVLALRYDCSLFVPICYRTGLGHWRIEVGDPIPTHQGGLKRSTEDVTRDVNTALEAAIRRDPANWFWVHNRWKNCGGSRAARAVSAA